MGQITSGFTGKAPSTPCRVGNIADQGLVPLAGLEPALRKKLDFESSASTNSATEALCVRAAISRAFSTLQGISEQFMQFAMQSIICREHLRIMERLTTPTKITDKATCFAHQKAPCCGIP